LKQKFITLSPGYGYYIEKVPQKVLGEIKNKVDSLLQKNFKGEKSHNERLAGEIDNEYKFNPGPNLSGFLKNSNQKYDNKYNYYESFFEFHQLDFKNNNEYQKSGLPITLDDTWINFMKKQEYNPIHFHTGVISWVIWYQIPFKFEDEIKYSKKPADKVDHGEFMFTYNHAGFGIQHLALNVDKRAEGHMVMFPSSLHHTVHPFYSSDDYRITVAGNFKHKNYNF